MSTLFLFVGLCLGSLFGFLLALLVVHGRAQSLAEEMLAQREGDGVARKRRGKGFPGGATSNNWGLARPHATIHSLGMD